MRTILLLCLTIAAGCSDDTTRGPADMAVADLTVPDLASLRISCGGTSCNSPDVCCVTMVGATYKEACATASACGSSGVQALCGSPKDCSTSSCCGTVMFTNGDGDGGMPMLLGGTTGCQVDCTGQFSQTPTTSTLSTKLCTTKADCAGFTGEIFGGQVPFNGCCTRPEIPQRFCAPDDPSYKTAGNYTCVGG